MSDNAQEPTMEEILASIRRIISEDDAPAAEGPPAAEAAPEPDPEPEIELEPEVMAAPEPEPEPEPMLAAEPEDDDVLELTDPIDTPSTSLGDLDVFTRDEPKAPEPKPAPVAFDEPDEPESLISAPTAGLAASYFGNLSRTLAMPSEGRTLEDLVSELLKPMLKEWLDQHLPSIVEAKVQAEVERVARRR